MISEFTEIVKVYFRYHIYYWIICTAIFCLQIALIFPGLLLFIIAGYGLLMVGKDIKFGWSSDKIRNLLMYKSLTKKELTPLESEVLNKHFGKIQRRKIILDEEVRKTTRRKIILIDILMLFLLVSPAFIPFLTASSPNIEGVFSISGRVIMTEFQYSYGFMSQTRQTVIYFHNCSIALASELTLEIGKNYQIWYASESMRVLRVKLIED